MARTRDHIVATYRRRARRYDATVNLYYLLGFRMRASRRKAVQALRLRPGDTVIEVGCGTGLNLALLERAVGPDGQIIGIDLSDAMLAQARRRVEAHGWTNVRLVQADALDYAFPAGVNAIISTYALSVIPESGEVIAYASRSLAPGGRLAVLDVKRPKRLPEWAARVELALLRPYGVTTEQQARRAWEAVWAAMDAGLTEFSRTDLFFGFVYLAAGTAKGARQ